MYTWVYKRKTRARKELDPKSKQKNVNVGLKAQNTCEKRVRPKKQANRMYTWVYKRKTPARKKLDQKIKQIECICGYRSAKHLQEGS